MAKLTPLSGSTPDFTIPAAHVGSDPLIDSMARRSADIEMKRNGVTISLRSWRRVRIWRVNYNLVLEEDVLRLGEYFDLRVFKYHPSWIPQYYFTSRWVESEFLPEEIESGKFKLNFTIEEVQA